MSFVTRRNSCAHHCRMTSTASCLTRCGKGGAHCPHARPVRWGVCGALALSTKHHAGGYWGREGAKYAGRAQTGGISMFEPWYAWLTVVDGFLCRLLLMNLCRLLLMNLCTLLRLPTPLLVHNRIEHVDGERVFYMNNSRMGPVLVARVIPALVLR